MFQKRKQFNLWTWQRIVKETNLMTIVMPHKLLSPHYVELLSNTVIKAGVASAY